MTRAGDRRGAWLVQEHSLSVLRRVVAACDEAAIAVVPVKGILSARTLYPDIADRVITDVDLRVLPRDLGRVQALAQASGWEVGYRMRAYDNLTLRIDGRDIDVEAHLLAANDVFWISSLLFFALVGVVWLAKRPPGAAAAADAGGAH